MSSPGGGATGSAPWAMWGQSTVVTINDAQSSPVQLARIDYKRPETWRFFFAANFLEVDAAPAADDDFEVQFNVIPGVGLTSFDTTRDTPLFTPPQDLTFSLMKFHLPAGSLPRGNIVTKRWTTTARSPLLDDSDPTSRLLIDHLVAQTLQCQATIIQSTSGPNVTAKFSLTAFFAPNVHVRPDWFVHQFAGETGGR